MKILRLALVASLFSLTLAAQEISVVVPVLRESSNSRPAHFNWKFESSGGGKAQVGQFACGSYWVAPAPGDNGVKLLSLTGNPQWNDLLSCSIDPLPEDHGLFSGKNKYGSHNPEKNILPKLPQAFTPAQGSCFSLVAAMQRNEAETGNGGTKAIIGEVADAYCVVTVLPSVPTNGGADMIRPNITGATKEFLTWNDFDLTRLPTYPFLEGKDAEGWKKEQIRWSHATEVFGGLTTEIQPGDFKKFSEGGRAFRAMLLVDDYASGVTTVFNAALLGLLSDQNTMEEKKGALAAMLSYGLDLYHARYDSGTAKRKAWSSGAGQSSGSFLPAVLVAALQRDEAKADELKKVAINNHNPDATLRGPQELRQITRGVTGVLLWGDGTPNPRDGNEISGQDWRYWSDFKTSHCFDSAITKGSANKGKKTAADPYGFIDGPANQPGTSYMGVSAGAVEGLAAAMILVPRIRSVVNTDDPIEYIDRLKRHGLWTLPDPVAVVSAADQANDSTVWMAAHGTVEWQKTWGPNPQDVRFAIEDGKGRFPSLHGNPMKVGYATRDASKNWDQIIALYKGDTFEANAVPLGTLVSPEILFEYGATPRAHMQAFNPDAKIHYTLDGSDPTAASPAYAEPVPVKPNMEVRAKAFLEGKKESAPRKRIFRP